MSYGLRQALLIVAGSSALVAAALVLARRQALSFRYTVGWLTIGVLGATGALLIPVIEPTAARFGMSPTGVLLAAATIVLLAITFQLSIAVSALQTRVRDLAEALALRNPDERSWAGPPVATPGSSGTAGATTSTGE